MGGRRTFEGGRIFERLRYWLKSVQECPRCLHGLVVLFVNKDTIALTNTKYFVFVT